MNKIIKGFEYEEGQPYIMPGHFGPSKEGWDGNVARYEDSTGITVMYVTDQGALASLLPPGYVPADPPVISVTFSMCRGINYMAGGGYNLVMVNAAVRFEGKRDKAEGNFHLVIWENEFIPILLGREVLGAPKLLADIPDAWMRDGKRGFAVSENGTRILDGEVWDLNKATDEQLRLMAEQSAGKITMGWKFIPSCDMRGADVSTATALPSKIVVKEAWIGNGKIEFHEAPWGKAVLSYRIINTLKELPVVQHMGAVMTRYSLDLLIHEQYHME